ncbi:zinc finger containing protein [Cotesia congregata filamentous virus 1]|uniref:Zinc finger containing protein n=1 Tax=Cotesia congregata filamentous virus 1 TaxID=3064291 RepID=A0ABC8QJQ5_9VIRU|nr:zinc finger containing protein [Cotesia congregata filamentous virus 1]
MSPPSSPQYTLLNWLVCEDGGPECTGEIKKFLFNYREDRVFSELFINSDALEVLIFKELKTRCLEDLTVFDARLNLIRYSPSRKTVGTYWETPNIPYEHWLTRQCPPSASEATMLATKLLKFINSEPALLVVKKISQLKPDVFLIEQCIQQQQQPQTTIAEFDKDLGSISPNDLLMLLQKRFPTTEATASYDPDFGYLNFIMAKIKLFGGKSITDRECLKLIDVLIKKTPSTKATGVFTQIKNQQYCRYFFDFCFREFMENAAHLPTYSTVHYTPAGVYDYKVVYDPIYDYGCYLISGAPILYIILTDTPEAIGKAKEAAANLTFINGNGKTCTSYIHHELLFTGELLKNCKKQYRVQVAFEFFFLKRNSIAIAFTCGEVFYECCKLYKKGDEKLTAQRKLSSLGCCCKPLDFRKSSLRLRPYACDVCLNSFESAFLLNSHINKTHSTPSRREAPICAECNISFATKPSLFRHIRRKHKHQPNSKTSTKT